MEVILYHHLGLGDHFICNGLVNLISKKFAKVFLICKESNFATVSCLYKDNQKIEVISIKTEPQDVELFARINGLKIIQIGFSDFNNKTFDKSFYSQFGVDFEQRYKSFKLPVKIENSDRIYDTLVKETPYCLIHRVCSQKIFNLEVNTELPKIFIEPGLTNNLLDYIKVIQNASEIHCVDSSVYHLIDSIEVSGKLYFHDVRNSSDNKITVSNKWQKI